jgi:hypothetical protein
VDSAKSRDSNVAKAGLGSRGERKRVVLRLQTIEAKEAIERHAGHPESKEEVATRKRGCVAEETEGTTTAIRPKDDEDQTKEQSQHDELVRDRLLSHVSSSTHIRDSEVARPWLITLPG